MKIKRLSVVIGLVRNSRA